MTETRKPVPEVAEDLVPTQDAAQSGVAGTAQRVAVVGPAGGRAVSFPWSAAAE
ncbi:hypothetical protein ACIBJF_50705 [Streptomyces sp. NPDC050743]|uniref:hypothetical protein n=1 Tax=Streptomyces sp. NPDC050743 TaxID=3365634 RepID=UPI0037AF8C9A